MKRAILFLNLGGPETLADVKPFLIRLFEDPEIIRIPFPPLRKLVARLIASSREKKSKELYASIGGGSPIRKLTDQQAAGLQERLMAAGHEALVRTAFTCSRPLVEDVVKELAEAGVDKFLSFPLYPQYSFTTTRGSLARVRRAIKKYAPKASVSEIISWPDHPLFLQAHAESIRRAVAEFTEPSDEKIHLLFSAHSIPEALVTKKGDPYKSEMERTVKGVVAKSGWRGEWTLAWQSKLGPVKWLEPFTDDVIRGLGAKGVKQILAVPVAFVTDHIETLHEIDVEFAEVAREAGVRDFRRTPGLNDNDTFLRALLDLALSQKQFWLNA